MSIIGKRVKVVQLVHAAARIRVGEQGRIIVVCPDNYYSVAVAMNGMGRRTLMFVPCELRYLNNKQVTL